MVKWWIKVWSSLSLPRIWKATSSGIPISISLSTGISWRSSAWIKSIIMLKCMNPRRKLSSWKKVFHWEHLWYISEGVDPETGNIIYRDLNGNGFIDPEDRTTLGNAQPKFIYGMTNTFSYAGFDLSVFLQGSQGNKILMRHASIWKVWPTLETSRFVYWIVGNDRVWLPMSPRW